MKFGRRLEAEQEEAYRPYYIRYNALKLLLKSASSVAPQALRDDAVHIRAAINRRLTPPAADIYSAVASTSSVPAQFMQMLEADLQRISKFVTLQVDDIKLRARALSSRAAAAQTMDELKRIEAAADEVAANATRLDRFILLNYVAFVKILKKHDRITGLCTRPWLLSRLSSGSFVQVRFDQVVTALSDAYAAVRGRRAGGAPQSAAAWVPPVSFERATTKYWVAPEDVLAVKCALVKHLPVLIFGRTPGLDASQRDVPSDSSLISSVYLDSASLDVYSQRLERHEGATLIRVRWYGDNGGDSADDAELFVERKTHHESWTTDNSVKERFRLKGKHVAALLRGELDLEAQLHKLRAGGASDADVARTRALAAEVQDEIRSRALAPALRTVYYRTAFQLATSNAVRVSLDTQLRMLDERGAARRGGWCRRLEPGGPPLGPDELIEFPFAVLEIKLQDASPPWVDELLASGRLVQCTKFSKFLHGTAALRPNEVRKVPHWWDDAAVVGGLLTSSAVVADATAYMNGGAPHQPTRALSQCSMGVAENGSEDDLAALRRPPTAPFKRAGSLTRSMSAPPSSSLSASISESVVVSVMSPRLAIAAAPGAEVKPSGPPGVAACWPALRAALGCGRRSTAGGGGGGDDGKSSLLLTPAAKRHVPIKIEPKTFFANERTMLQWLNMATLILFTSLALISYNDPVARNKVMEDGALDYSSQLAGAVLAPVSVVFIAYALWTYLWRARRIARREATARYDDRYGPAVLVFLLLAVTVTSIVLAINHADWHHPNGSGASVSGASAKAAGRQRATLSALRVADFTLAAGGLGTLGTLNATAAAASSVCGQLPVAWPPFFRPKGAVFLPAHSATASAAASPAALLLGGDYELLQLSTRNVSNARVLPAPDWSITAVASVQLDSSAGVLVGAARPLNSLALYDPATHALSRITPLGAAAGAAGATSLLGDTPAISAMGAGPNGTLLVAGPRGVEVLKLGDVGGATASGDVSAPLAWQAVRLLPAAVLAGGLADAHTAGVAYDARADVLYLLFDRARPPTLRAMRLATGDVLNDWQLPLDSGAGAARAPTIHDADAASLSWSGLALAPDGGALYAARAAPPQLWRFARRADGQLACGDAPA